MKKKRKTHLKGNKFLWLKKEEAEKSEHHPNRRTATVEPPHTRNIPGFQSSATGCIQSAIYTNREMSMFLCSELFLSCFLVHCLSVVTVYSAQPSRCRAVLLNVGTGSELSAAVFSTLKLQNGKVISGSHHVDQLVEENKRKAVRETCWWPSCHCCS